MTDLDVPARSDAVADAASIEFMTGANNVLLQALVRVGRALRDIGRAQEELWARLERIDPDPWERLHWVSTTSGWRLYGSVLPGSRPCRQEELD